MNIATSWPFVYVLLHSKFSASIAARKQGQATKHSKPNRLKLASRGNKLNERSYSRKNLSSKKTNKRHWKASKIPYELGNTFFGTCDCFWRVSVRHSRTPISYVCGLRKTASRKKSVLNACVGAILHETRHTLSCIAWCMPFYSVDH
jgi:hypothetical protein